MSYFGRVHDGARQPVATSFSSSIAAPAVLWTGASGGALPNPDTLRYGASYIALAATSSWTRDVEIDVFSLHLLSSVS